MDTVVAIITATAKGASNAIHGNEDVTPLATAPGWISVGQSETMPLKLGIQLSCRTRRGGHGDGEASSVNPKEQLIRRLVQEGVEGGKIDFKRTIDLGNARGKAKLAKLVSAIINTDSTVEDEWGYIILGAEPGKLVGGFEELRSDNYCAGISRAIQPYLDPPVRVEVWPFEDGECGAFGAIAIPPRLDIDGPHFIARGFDDGAFRIKLGECYVRVGEETRLAQKADFDRIYRAKYLLQPEHMLRGVGTSDAPELTALFEQLDGSLSPMFEFVPAALHETVGELEDQLEKLRSQASNKIDRFDATEFSPEVSERAIAIYRASVEKRAAKLKERWTAWLDYNRDLGRIVKLSPAIRNEGRAVAADIDLFIEFPPNLRLSEKVPNDPSPVPATAELRMVAQRLQREREFLPHLPTIPPGIRDFAISNEPPPVTGPNIDDQRVHYTVKRLKHGFAKILPPVFLSCPDGDSEYRVPCRLHSATLPERTSVVLVLRVSKPRSDEAHVREYWDRLIPPPLARRA